MDPLPVLIQGGLISARFWMPVVKGWLDPGLPVCIKDDLTIADIRSKHQVAIVDSILASALLQDHLIVTELAIASRGVSALNLVTDRRPDSVNDVILSTPKVSLSGRAVAETVIPQYYGIRILEWTDRDYPVNGNHAVITEGANALIQLPDDMSYHEDLGRAWFLFTDAPFVSHVCLAPAHIASKAPERIQETLEKIHKILSVSTKRGRELRRNLARDHGVDREIVTEFLAGQTNNLSDQELAGLSTLYVQSGVLDNPNVLTRSLFDYSQ